MVGDWPGHSWLNIYGLDVCHHERISVFATLRCLSQGVVIPSLIPVGDFFVALISPEDGYAFAIHQQKARVYLQST